MKQFTIIYDKEQEEYATILNTLVSEMEEVKNVGRDLKVYKRDMLLTDKDYALFVGNQSSLKYRDNFKDKYSRYGIHLGYRGTKGWIFCEKAKWNKKTYKEFHYELLNLYKELDMNPSKVQEFIDASVAEYITTGSLSSVPIGTTLAQQAIWGAVVSIQAIVLPFPISLIYVIHRWVKSLFAESARIDQQYRFAIVLFFSEYLKDYLKITTNDSYE